MSCADICDIAHLKVGDIQELGKLNPVCRRLIEHNDTNISKEITATVKSDYGQKIKVFDTEIPHSIRAVEATAEGKSIFAYDKSGKVAAAYEQFGKEVVTKKHDCQHTCGCFQSSQGMLYFPCYG